MPERIQLRRTKGWRKPADAIVVARPSEWGNPILLADVAHQYPSLDRKRVANLVVRDFRVLALHGSLSFPNWLSADDSRGPVAFTYPSLARIFTELRGRDVACWCPLDHACHGDVLVDIANGPAPEHEHQRRFDGDDPYLVCWCGARWDALTGARIGGAS